MPTADQHQKRTDHHLAFLQTIDPDEFCDWMGVVAFYAALHLVEKMRAFAGEHSDDHQERREYVRHHHPAIFASYRGLFDISMAARYHPDPLHWLLPTHVTGYLEDIERYVNAYSPPP